MRAAVAATVATAALLVPAAAWAPMISSWEVTAEPGAADGVAADGHCSIREALDKIIGQAAADCDPHSTSLSGPEGHLILPAGIYTLEKPGANEDSNATGDLDTPHYLRITGAGAASTTILAAPALHDRILDISNDAAVDISDVTITGGRLPDASGAAGGGINNASQGTLALHRVVIGDNKAGYPAVATMGPGVQGGAGGGIASNGPLTVEDSTISNNVAANGGQSANAPGGQGGPGGGIYANGAVTITRSTITGNHTGDGADGAPAPQGMMGGPGGGGGGIYTSQSLTVTDSVISGNTGGRGGNGSAASSAPSGGFGGGGGIGGGIAVSSGSVTITGSAITGNTAGAGGTGGGGVAPAGGAGGGAGGGLWIGILPTATITASTISGNASGDGGTSPTAGGNGGDGGGLAITQTDLTMTNTTIANNTSGKGANAPSPGAGGAGGGLQIGFATFSSTLHITNSTIAGNRTGAGGTGTNSTGNRDTGGGLDFINTTGPLANSIVAGNAPAQCEGSIGDGGSDVSFPDATCPGANADPLLAALADNGGPTETMALGAGSPAIDRVPATGAGCPGTDQRGTTRPQGAGCDSGAYELVPPPPAPQPADTGGSGNPPPPPPPPAGTAPDKTPPKVKLLLKKMKLRTALKKGFLCNFSTNELGSAKATLGGRYAKGSLKVKRVGKQRLVCKFTKKAKKKFAHAKKLTFKLVLIVKDLAGNRTKKTAKVVLKG